MPPRAAARKAARLAAAQLESSPPPSDTRAREFGEPSKPRTPVKVTYGRRKRGPGSPTKSSEDSPDKGKSVAKRPRASLSALVSSPGDKASGSRMESPILLSDEETDASELDGLKSPLRGNSSGRKTGGTTPVFSAKKPSSSVPGKGKSKAPASSISSTKRKRAVSISSTSSLSELSDSDLTPISPQSAEPSTMPPPPRARSASTLTALPSSQLSVSTSALRRTASVATLGGSTVDDEPWSLTRLGSLAWVKVNSLGNLAGEDGAEEDGATYWWPAKVTNPKEPLQVSLFGDGPDPTGPAQRADLTVDTPSASNILPMALRGRIRFNEMNYKTTSGDVAGTVSPRKRRKLDIDTRWTEARDLMLKEDEDANEGLPMLLSSHFSRDASFSVKALLTGKSKVVDEIVLSDSEDNSSMKRQQKPWKPPPRDETLEIPGELVLAREKKMYTEYWPAKLLEYIPPSNPKQHPRYKAQFYDGEIKNIDADWFHTQLDKGFGTCKLGRDKFNYGLEEDRDDTSAPLVYDAPATEAHDEGALHTSTPEPVSPPLEDFEDLSIAEQFEYVKPVLGAVIDGRFEPANKRHDQFMRGAAERRKVCESGYSRGSLQQDEVEELLHLVRRWATKREKRRELGIILDDRDMRPSAEEDGACIETSQVPTTDNPAERTVTHERGLTGLQTDELAVSEAEGPPPSQMTLDADADVHEAPPRDESTVAPPSNAFSPRSDVPELVRSTEAAGNPVNVEPLALEKQTQAETQRPRPKLSFKDLSAIDQITYCQNILLHEAVLQLLLWRSGERTSLGLLTKAEEQRLHDVAFEMSNESDWVHEILRLRQAAEGKMLPWSNNDKAKASAALPTPAGGTRTRTKRGL
ncbi:hypothetical protein FOMPIDRAFT_85458 [Fomitopsis schrenkii]|uniref:Uncharacterized protein n=1 Tax=Fomitopsis schrenkii TaxID=2126942 RepID=S8FEL9_FOMSC|nr:hypothetical protein FOMPIDRAFT_85458 [Fomitopsis schrenkii]